MPSAMTLSLVSVIIPIFNAEKYLERCLDSVLAQDYSEIEIILVNDGSTDGSESICKRYCNSFGEKVRLYSQENKGASMARKLGISKARGEYLMFVDSDDYVSNRYVSGLYQALIQSRSSIALCPMKIVAIGESPDITNKLTICDKPIDNVLTRFFKYEFWGFWGGIYSRKLFERVKFPLATINEDYFVKAQILVHEKRVGYVEEPLYFYEKHQDSLSSQTLSLRALGEFDNALSTWKYIKEHASTYSSQALAIVSEVACKWIGELNTKGWNKQYHEYRCAIRKFIRKNIGAILTNPYLLWKIKVVIILNLFR